MFLLTGPNAPPENVTASQTPTTILLAWGKVNCSDRNSLISHYLISYVETDTNPNVKYTNATGFQETITGLIPSTVYLVSIAAVNEDQAIGPAFSLTVTTGTGIIMDSKS